MRVPRVSPEAYRRVTLFALLALCFIIVTGAARAPAPGPELGCSDWPNCEAGQFVAPAEFHAWVEFGNRLVTGLVSIAVILAVLGSLVRTPRRGDLTWLSLGLVAGVVAQVVLGAIVVKTHLLPATVGAHFLVSMVLVANAVVLHRRAGRAAAPGRAVGTPGLRGLAWSLVALTAVVLVVGTLVTGAGPHSGDPGEVDRLTLDIREVARVHGVLALTLLALTLLTLWRVHRDPTVGRTPRRRAAGR
ncbi:MAG: COX15/CtaA family protein [Acidimicrobiia bacterium]|nr:COX15/CtaA family protein [Acidimicrobiia bacterium]